MLDASFALSSFRFCPLVEKISLGILAFFVWVAYIYKYTPLQQKAVS